MFEFSWVSLGTIAYNIVLIIVILRIMYETHSSSKAMAYIMLCVFVPFFGIIFYIFFGINYWTKKKYHKKNIGNAQILQSLSENVTVYGKSDLRLIKDETVEQNIELSKLLIKDLGSPLTSGNRVKVFANGENKFPDMLESIKKAKHHIHLEYYIFDYDEIGKKLIEALIQKAKEGIEVRFIYDDFGSPNITNAVEKRMKEAGIQVYAFYKIKFYLLANRFNYRNHRKIMIIDGNTSYIGGINVSDKYINSEEKKKLYWRDTHIKMEGTATYYLQFLFITDWNFCSEDKMPVDEKYFPEIEAKNQDCFVQIAAGGPDSPLPTILYSLIQAINLAQKEILITTPYFIPGDSILDALCVAALGGVKVKLLVPRDGDSKLVNAASRSYYSKLLEAGAEVYLYHKGFVHAKTMVTDSQLSVIGTANMDYRSFELNFEVNAVVYDKPIAEEMTQLFYDDIQYAEKLDPKQWRDRPWYQQLPERVARLFSPVL